VEEEILMTITITDGTTTLTLSPHLQRPTEANETQSYGEDNVTLGLRLISTRMMTEAGKKIVLEATLDGEKLRGRFLWSEALQFRPWADSGATLILNYHGVLDTCKIPRDGVNITPVFPKTNQPLTSNCSGTLTLLGV
jgi:hypothetical protein